MTDQKKSPSYDKKINGDSSVAPEDIIIGINTATKIIRLYEPNNQLFIQQVDIIFQFVENSLRREGECAFSLWQNTLFFNKVKLKFDISNYHIFKVIIKEFKQKEVGSFSFIQGLTKKDLSRFLVKFAFKPDTLSRTSFETFQQELLSDGIQHIALEKISPQDLKPSKKEKAAKDYFLSIMHLGDLFEKEKEGKAINPHTTRRLMQSMVKNITENESFLYGMTTLKNFDEYTLNHSVNVCILSMALGMRLGLDKVEVVDLGICAFFHDIGKLDTPLEILNKAGELTDEERQIIERHPYSGADKLLRLSMESHIPLKAVHVSMEHHIKENLTGYPHYLKRKSVSLYSKIVKIIDFFDAVTTKRVYRKKAFTRDEALAMMSKSVGEEFNPLIFKVFLNMMSGYPIGSLVLLNTGEIAVVMETHKDPALFHQPEVKLITDRNGSKIYGRQVDLSKSNTGEDETSRSIIKILDPEKYGINVSDYFLAEVPDLL